MVCRCKQMQVSKRDARHAMELKVQIRELQKGIEPYPGSPNYSERRGTDTNT
jgi:hypothetical protein